MSYSSQRLKVYKTGDILQIRKFFATCSKTPLPVPLDADEFWSHYYAAIIKLTHRIFSEQSVLDFLSPEPTSEADHGWESDYTLWGIAARAHIYCSRHLIYVSPDTASFKLGDGYTYKLPYFWYGHTPDVSPPPPPDPNKQPSGGDSKKKDSRPT